MISQEEEFSRKENGVCVCLCMNFLGDGNVLPFDFDWGGGYTILDA